MRPSHHGLLAIAGESLRRAGFEMTTAADGESAIARLQESPVAAVFFDLTMSGMTGVEVFRAIRAVRSDVPMVLTNGYSRQPTEARFNGENIDAFIQKPFLPSALVRAMQAAACVRQPGQVAS